MLVALLVAVSAVALSACGGTDEPATVDHTIVESAIATSIARQQHVIAIVACPKGVRQERGKRFTCTATLASGRQVPVNASVQDDKGNVRYSGFEGFVGGKPSGAQE